MAFLKCECREGVVAPERGPGVWGVRGAAVRWMLDFDLGIVRFIGAGLRRDTREDERERTEGVVGKDRSSM